jgi:hypothetical protein
MGQHDDFARHVYEAIDARDHDRVSELPPDCESPSRASAVAGHRR